MEMPKAKTRQSCRHLIFIMGIPTLVKQHLYIEMAPCAHGWLAVLSTWLMKCLWILHKSDHSIFWICKIGPLNVKSVFSGTMITITNTWWPREHFISWEFVLYWTSPTGGPGNINILSQIPCYRKYNGETGKTVFILVQCKDLLKHILWCCAKYIQS